MEEIKLLNQYGTLLGNDIYIPRWVGLELFRKRFPQYKWVNVNVLSIALKRCHPKSRVAHKRKFRYLVFCDILEGWEGQNLKPILLDSLTELEKYRENKGNADSLVRSK